MRMFKVFLLLLFTSLTLVLHVESLSSPFHITTVSSSSSWNITSGSSISTSSKEPGFWLSPSGIFAFGFYPLCHNCEGYKIGIWMPHSADKTVVWSLEVDDGKPIYGTASILLNYDGVFMIRQAGSTMKPLFGAELGPVSYALIQDTGNLVIYNSDSEVLWQSFDYLGNTILPGQTLMSGHKLLSSNFYSDHVLIMQKYRNLELLRCSKNNNRRMLDNGDCRFIWESGTHKEGGDIVLNLDSTGCLSLVDRNGLVIKNLTKGEDWHQNCDCRSIIYRATLGSDGVFRLYRETIKSDSGKSVELWHSYCISDRELDRALLITFSIFGAIIGVIIIGSLLACIVDKYGLPRCIGRYMNGY